MHSLNELDQRLKILKGKENEIIGDIVFNLYKLDKCQGYRELGYSSLFAYCTQSLGYSEGAACRRIKAARYVELYPEILEKLKAGTIHLCAIVELSKVTDSKPETLVLMAEGRSKREVQKEVAKLLPPTEPKRERIVPKQIVVEPLPLFSTPSPSTSSPPPVTEQRYDIYIEADNEFKELLDKARLFSSEFKTADILKKALKHFVKVKSPLGRVKRRKSTKRSRYIPLAIKESVYIRDKGQCTFYANGKRCSEVNHLQYDHIDPYALGGGNEESNLRLRCPAHNRLEAERVFGRYCSSQKQPV